MITDGEKAAQTTLILCLGAFEALETNASEARRFMKKHDLPIGLWAGSGQVQLCRAMIEKLKEAISIMEIRP